MTATRRGLLVVSGIVTLIYGLRALRWDRLPGRGPHYVDMPDLPPFRRLEEQGQTSGATAAFLGLAAPPDDAEQRRARADTVRANLCTALFGPALPIEIVPIAYFSGFRCPYCRALERDLDTLLAEFTAYLRLIPHELPIFGLPSKLAARASVAAARQGTLAPPTARSWKLLCANRNTPRKVVWRARIVLATADGGFLMPGRAFSWPKVRKIRRQPV